MNHFKSGITSQAMLTRLTFIQAFLSLRMLSFVLGHVHVCVVLRSGQRRGQQAMGHFSYPSQVSHTGSVLGQPALTSKFPHLQINNHLLHRYPSNEGTE